MAEAQSKVYFVMQRRCNGVDNDKCMGYFTTLEEARDYIDVLDAEQPLFNCKSYYVAEAENRDGTVDKSNYAIAYYYDVMVYNSFARKNWFVIKTRSDTQNVNTGAVKERVEFIKFFDAEVMYRIVLNESNEARAIMIATQITSELLLLGGGEICQSDVNNYFTGNGCNFYVEQSKKGCAFSAVLTKEVSHITVDPKMFEHNGDDK